MFLKKCTWSPTAHWMHMKNPRGGEKQEILSIGGGFLLSFLRRPSTLLCDCMSLGEIAAFLTGDQVHVFYKVNHSNSLLDSYTNIKI